jgi:ParB/RepB/Spo0J family partition protein
MPTPRLVPRDFLRPPSEPMRVEMGDEAMADLVESIKQLGIVVPLLVSPIYESKGGDECLTPDPMMGEPGKEPAAYEVIDGHRRLTAASYLELETVPVMIFEDPEQARYAIMVHANVCREDVTPYEEGVQFIELATKYQWSMEQLMQVFRKSEDYINTRCAIAAKDANVAAAARDRRINMAQATEILKCDDPAFRLALLEQAAVHGATARSLRVMRHNRLSEEREAQGQLAINASPQFVPGAMMDADKCIWCMEPPPLGHAVRVVVCDHHQRDLETVLKRVGLRAFYSQEPAKADA